MKLTAESIHGLVTSLLMSQFDEPVPSPDCHMEFWEYFCSPRKRVAIAAPRGHAKSTALTHSCTLASVLFREKKYVLIVSDTEGQAVQFLEDIKRELLENELLIETFGIRRFVKDATTDIIVQFNDGKEFRIQAKGSEQKVRGLKWRNMRPDLIIGDDLENDEIVLNEERREKFRRWFYNALLPCMSKSGHIRIVGTILHLDSLLERLMPPLDDESTVTDGLRQYSDAPGKRGWLSVRYRAHTDLNDFSQILWEEQHPEEELRTIYQGYVEMGFPDGYAQEYLNYPIDETFAFFRKDDLLPIPQGGLEDYMEYYAAADLAISEKDSRAYTVIAVAGLTRDRTLRVVDIRRFRTNDSNELINEIFNVNYRYKPELFGIEQENIAKSIGAPLNVEMAERGQVINIEKLPPHGTDKIKRARSIQSRTRAGLVQFDTEADWYPSLELELLQFPKGRYVDQVDALAWIGIMLDKMVDPVSEKELADQLWEEEFEDSFEIVDMGACTTTGY